MTTADLEIPIVSFYPTMAKSLKLRDDSTDFSLLAMWDTLLISNSLASDKLMIKRFIFKMFLDGGKIINIRSFFLDNSIFILKNICWNHQSSWAGKSCIKERRQIDRYNQSGGQTILPDSWLWFRNCMPSPFHVVLWNTNLVHEFFNWTLTQNLSSNIPILIKLA